MGSDNATPQCAHQEVFGYLDLFRALSLLLLKELKRCLKAEFLDSESSTSEGINKMFGTEDNAPRIWAATTPPPPRYAYTNLFGHVSYYSDNMNLFLNFFPFVYPQRDRC
jgi:hypothetical protein